MNPSLRRLAWIPGLALLLWMGARLWDLNRQESAPRHADPWNPPILVHLSSHQAEDPLPLEIDGHWQLRSAEQEDGPVLTDGSNFRGLLSQDAAGIRLGPFQADRDHLWVEPTGAEALRLDGLSYDGRLRLDLRRDRIGRPEEIQVSLELPLESYVLGVVCGEMATMTPGIHEALRAQAIAARSYALWRLGQGRILRDDSRDQVYQGADFITKEARAAVRETRGLVLFYEGEVLPAYFHRNCGGATADAVAAAFSRRAWPPLAGVEDPGCRQAFGEWERTVPVARLDRLAQRHHLGQWLRGFSTLRQDASGRLLEIRLLGEEKHLDLPADQVRSAFGLPSTRWSSTEVRADGSLRVRGRGYGHGVGMCQEGAMRLARDGQSAEVILAHYYPGANLHRLSTRDQSLLP